MNRHKNKFLIQFIIQIQKARKDHCNRGLYLALGLVSRWMKITKIH